MPDHRHTLSHFDSVSCFQTSEAAAALRFARETDLGTEAM